MIRRAMALGGVPAVPATPKPRKRRRRSKRLVRPGFLDITMRDAAYIEQAYKDLARRLRDSIGKEGYTLFKEYGR